MKLYLANGTHYEKQADVPKGTKFETVEFPFAASPKADFVAWLNDQQRVTVDDSLAVPAGDEWRLPRAIPTPNPAQPAPHHTALTVALDEAFLGAPLGQQLTLAGIALENARTRIG